MLSTSDVWPFRVHPLKSVSRYARRFVEAAGDRSTIDADRWYESMEHYPHEAMGGPPWEASYSPESLARKALELSEVRYWCDGQGQRHALSLPVDYVDRVRLSYVMPLLSLLPRTEQLQPYRARLRHRLAVAALPPERLLANLIDLCDGMPPRMGSADARDLLLPWIEALAVRAHPGEALEALTAPRSDPCWSRFAAVHLVAAARYEPAIPLMLEWIEGEGEWQTIYAYAAQQALAEVDTDATVAAIGEAFHLGPEMKFIGALILGGFRRPSAEAMLLELLERERDLGARCWLISSLCDLGTTEGLARLRTLKEGVDYVRARTECLDRAIAVIELIGNRDPASVASLEAEVLRREEEQLRRNPRDPEAGFYR